MSQLPEQWRARLLALPGVLTVLSVLAVWLGTHPPTHTVPARVVASPVSPAAPELAPLTQHSAGAGAVLLATPPPLPFLPATAALREAHPHLVTVPPHLKLELSLLGRRQTDGG